MTNPRPTKRLKAGMIVTYWRGWIIPYDRTRGHPRGIWREAAYIRMANGSEFRIPAGVQVAGDAGIPMGKL